MTAAWGRDRSPAPHRRSPCAGPVWSPANDEGVSCPPLPAKLEALVAGPNPAVIATIREDGSPHTAVTWYDWQAGRILVNMDESRRRLVYLRNDPRVSLTILSSEGWHQHVTVMGRAISLEDDPELVDIDRLSIRYEGVPYPKRRRRRVGAWIEVDSWHAWPPRLAAD